MTINDQDIDLSIDGMGIVMYSPATVAGIPQGYDYLSNKYSEPSQVADHIKKGDMVGFCTGTGGNFILKIREGDPSEEIDKEYPVAISLGIQVKDETICFIDLFWLMEWDYDCPPEQSIKVPNGYYHIVVMTKRPESGIWGDDQVIYIYLKPMNTMPQLMWNGVPQLFTE